MYAEREWYQSESSGSLEEESVNPLLLTEPQEGPPEERWHQVAGPPPSNLKMSHQLQKILKHLEDTLHKEAEEWSGIDVAWMRLAQEHYAMRAEEEEDAEAEEGAAYDAMRSMEYPPHQSPTICACANCGRATASPLSAGFKCQRCDQAVEYRRVPPPEDSQMCACESCERVWSFPQPAVLNCLYCGSRLWFPWVLREEEMEAEERWFPCGPPPGLRESILAAAELRAAANIRKRNAMRATLCLPSLRQKEEALAGASRSQEEAKEEDALWEALWEEEHSGRWSKPAPCEVEEVRELFDLVDAAALWEKQQSKLCDLAFPPCVWCGLRCHWMTDLNRHKVANKEFLCSAHFVQLTGDIECRLHRLSAEKQATAEANLRRIADMGAVQWLYAFRD